MLASCLLACLHAYPLAALSPPPPVLPLSQVFNEDRKQINGLLLVHLPDGPTAQFRMSNLKLSSDIKVGAGAVGWRQAGLGWAVQAPAAACVGAPAVCDRSCNVREQPNHALPRPRPRPRPRPASCPHACRATGAPPATAPSWC